MIVIVADTSGLIAATDVRDPDHEGARHVLTTAVTLVISPFVLAETDHLARRIDPVARHAILDEVIDSGQQGRIVVPEVTIKHLATARAVIRHYRDLDLDLTDAVSVALAARYATDAVLTLDRRDFRTIKPLTPHKHFRILPDDL